jgi:hypothetical protein
MACAAHILCELAEAPFLGEPLILLTGQQYDRALDRLQQREEEVFGNREGLPIDRDDVSGGLLGGWPPTMGGTVGIGCVGRAPALPFLHKCVV